MTWTEKLQDIETVTCETCGKTILKKDSRLQIGNGEEFYLCEDC